MKDERPLYETDRDSEPDPDETPIRDRRLFTQPYDLVVESLIEQIAAKTMFLRPLSERPQFQRRYVWSNQLASRLIESILLNVPIPPCYLSQSEEFELDVIDGQQRLFSIYRFLENQLKLTGLEVLTEFAGLRFFELPDRAQRRIKTHTLRCVLITNESHPEIKFDVFQRLNTNTVPLNAQELRNCIYRGTLNSLLKEAVEYEPWLRILNRRKPDKRMRDEELVLRFYAFRLHGLQSYRTPQKHWLNDTARQGKSYGAKRIAELGDLWRHSIDVSLIWFDPKDCFRRGAGPKSKAINRALFDLIMLLAADMTTVRARKVRNKLRTAYRSLFDGDEFVDLISKSVDHTKRTKRRFTIWNQQVVNKLG